MTARDTILNRLRGRNLETALEREFYCSPEDYQVDLDMIWYRDWLFVGHDCEVLNPGNYLTVQIGEYPVMVVRDRDGGLRAFHNTCRHRGSRICSARARHRAAPGVPLPSMDLRARWPLDRGARHGQRVRQIPAWLEARALRQRGRLHLGLPGAGRRPDFEPIRRHLEPYFLPHKLQQTKVAFESTIIEQANWKLVWENNRECYHCAANHPELIRTFPEDPTATDGEDAAADPKTAAKWAHWESIGLPSRFQISRRQPVPHRAHAAARGCGELHHVGPGRRAPARCPIRSPEPDIGTSADVPLSRRPGTTCSPITPFPFACCPSAPPRRS